MRIKSIITALALPIALAACGTGTEGELPKGEALANVAAPAGKQWTEVVSKTEEGYRMGNPEAKLQFVEYGAITCPGCAQFSVQSTEELNGLVNNGNVSFEFRPFMVHGIQDMPGFLLAQCNGPETYFPLIESLFADQQNWLSKISTITDAEQQQMQGKGPAEMSKFLAGKFGLVDFVKTRGVAEDKANSCLGDQAAIDGLIKSTEAASKSGTVTGTPTFFLNGTKMTQQGWPEVKAVLKNAGAR